MGFIPVLGQNRSPGPQLGPQLVQLGPQFWRKGINIQCSWLFQCNKVLFYHCSRSSILNFINILVHFNSIIIISIIIILIVLSRLNLITKIDKYVQNTLLLQKKLGPHRSQTIERSHRDFDWFVWDRLPRSQKVPGPPHFIEQV
jgi:hypothetical protein